MEIETGEPEVVVCGTLVADIKVHPFQPIARDEAVTLRYVDGIALAAGGLVMNTGVALARLGVATGALARLGGDALGDMVWRALRDGGVDVAGVTRLPGAATGTALVCIDALGERTFHYARGANDDLDRGDLEAQWARLTSARAVVIGYLGELPLLDPALPALLARLRASSSALLVLETAGPQHRMRALLDACLPSIDVFIPSWDEARDLTGAATPEAALTDLERAGGPAYLGVKLGDAGCLVRDARGAYRVPAYPARAVDATGAGDSFLAGFLAAVLRGADTPTACRVGNLAGALCVGSLESVPALPAYEGLLARARAADGGQEGAARSGWRRDASAR
jgi:ribokinase